MSLEDHLYRFLPAYSSLPYPVKLVSAGLYKLLPLRLRHGKAYMKFLRLAEAELGMSLEETRNFQIRQLRSLTKHAVDTTSFYKEFYSKSDIHIKSFEDFSRLPLLSKEHVRGHSEEFLSSLYPRSALNCVSTGGSTGEPLLLFKEKGIARSKELAYMTDQWSRVGYEPGRRMAILRSALVRGRKNKNLWEYEPIRNRWIYSAFDLTQGNMKRILQHMRHIKPDYLHVYPSALTQLASFMKACNEPPISSLRGILSGSENTLPSQISLFEKVFNCPVFRWYGMGEMAALAGSCEHSHIYHSYNTYSYVELLDETGDPVEEVGARGEIVGTAFHNYAMPLIRYRTGDYAIYAGKQCQKCGRTGMMFSEIEGRAQEFVIDKNGNRHALAPFIFGIHDTMWTNIAAIQFVQKEKGILELLAVSTKLSNKETINYLGDVFESRFSPNFIITIKPVDTIPKTPAGKQMYLDQRMPL